jgi:hypothetical protein
MKAVGLLLLATLLLGIIGCENNSNDQDNILTVKERHEAELMAIPGVVGVGIGERDGAEVIVVYVEDRTAEIDRNVPDTLEGYPVLIEVTGPIIAL